MTTTTTSNSVNTAITQEIRLLPQEQFRYDLKKSWKCFLANISLPALWVTAHTHIWIPPKENESKLEYKPRQFRKSRNSCSRFCTCGCRECHPEWHPRFAPIDELRQPVVTCRSVDDRANQHRVFLQKLVMRLNRKILKSRTADKTFSFRGTVERSIDDTDGTQLHFHFFLWEPNAFFARDPSMMAATSAVLKSLWLSRVNNLETKDYKPIQIDTVTKLSHARRLSAYMLKANPLTKSYELFDDWSTSRGGSRVSGRCTCLERKARLKAARELPSDLLIQIQRHDSQHLNNTPVIQSRGEKSVEKPDLATVETIDRRPRSMSQSNDIARLFHDRNHSPEITGEGELSAHVVTELYRRVCTGQRAIITLVPWRNTKEKLRKNCIFLRLQLPPAANEDEQESLEKFMK